MTLTKKPVFIKYRTLHLAQKTCNNPWSECFSIGDTVVCVPEYDRCFKNFNAARAFVDAVCIDLLTWHEINIYFPAKLHR